MKIAKVLAAGLCAALIAAAAVDAQAQFPGGGGRTRGGGRPPGDMQRGERPQGPADVSELVEFRLQSFEDDLKLTPAQQKLWGPFAERVRAVATDIMRERARTKSDSIAHLAAPQQIDHALDVARDRLTALEDVAASAKTLYDTLAPEQKLLADSRIATLLPVIGGGPPPVPQQGEPRRGGPDGGFGGGPRGRAQ